MGTYSISTELVRDPFIVTRKGMCQGGKVINETIKRIHDLNVRADLDSTLAVWEREIVRDLSSRTQLALGGLEEIEISLKEGEGGNPGMDTLKEWFHKIIVDLQGIPAALAALPRGVSLGRGIVGCLNEIWAAALTALDNFIRARKEQLGIDSWSLGISAGVPFGVSTAFSITFK